MLSALHHRITDRRGPLPVTAESALWTAGALIATLLGTVILFLWAFAPRAN